MHLVCKAARYVTPSNICPSDASLSSNRSHQLMFLFLKNRNLPVGRAIRFSCRLLNENKAHQHRQEEEEGGGTSRQQLLMIVYKTYRRT